MNVSFVPQQPSPAAKQRLLLDNVAPLANVKTVQELSDILVANAADLLDVGGGLGDVLEGIAGEDELVLLGLGGLDIDALGHGDAADELLAEEVPAHSMSVLPSAFLASLSQTPPGSLHT